jgi:cell cycle arrest protein BUB3
VKCVAYSASTSILVSASWDSTLHIHNLSHSNHVPAVVPLTSKPFSISLTSDKLVVAMANRSVYIYDMKAIATVASKAPPEADKLENIVNLEPWQRRESSMKFMTRAVACMPNGLGYTTSSIEGRVAVEWFDPSETSQTRKYAFKCHRETVDGIDII